MSGCLHRYRRERTRFTLMTIFLELELELETFKPFHSNSTTKSRVQSNWQFQGDEITHAFRTLSHVPGKTRHLLLNPIKL